MPLIKTERKDIIRLDEVIEMYKEVGKLANTGDPLLYEWIDKNGKKQYHRVWINYSETCCLIAILTLFGKRISEVITLKRKDVWEKRNYLYIRFRLLKKKQKKEKIGEPIHKTLRIHKEKSWELSQFIVKWVNQLPHSESYLFSGKSRPHMQVVRNKKTGKIYK